jgi:hypothetical protein
MRVISRHDNQSVLLVRQFQGCFNSFIKLNSLFKCEFGAPVVMSLINPSTFNAKSNFIVGKNYIL